MKRKYTTEERERISAEITGKTVEVLEYVEDGEYWEMVFTDGSETAFRFMAELVEIA